MKNNTLNNIGIVLMLLFVIVIDCIIFSIMHQIQEFEVWFIVMLVPTTMTATALYISIKCLDLTDKIKSMFANTF